MATATQPEIDLNKYMRLNRRFPLMPIANGAHLKAAIGIINELLDKDRSPEEEAYLDVLGDLVEKYELKHHPMAPATDAEILAGRLDAMGISQAQMARDTGIAESTISAVLHGARKFTRAQISKVSAYLKVPPQKFKHED